MKRGGFKIKIVLIIVYFIGKQPYLSNVLEFQPTRLKMLARTNTLPINSVLHRMKLHTTSGCEMWGSGSNEDLFHFMLDCSEYTPIRNNYLNLITERFPGLAFLELSPFDKMQFLIGDVSFSLDTNIGIFFDELKDSQSHPKWDYLNNVRRVF